MVELTKEQARKRTDAIIKAHHWFGSNHFRKVFRNYDYYVDDDNVLFYVFPKEKLKKVV